jgi:hypothetical protein
MALELVVRAELVHGTIVLAEPVLVSLALAVLELAPLNPAAAVICLFQMFAPSVPEWYVINWDWITGC